jgi:hypothetical protein
MTSGTGSCTITASQPGDDNYNAAETVSHTVEAAKANQVISFTQPVSPAVYGTTFTLEASTSSGLDVTFAVSGICSLAGDAVTMTSGTGSCTVITSQAGDDNYNAAEPVSHTVEAAKADQVISFTQPASPAVYGTSFFLEASSSSGLEVSFTVSGACTFSENEVTMTSGTGICTVTTSQAGDDNYNAAEPVSHTGSQGKPGNHLHPAGIPCRLRHDLHFGCIRQLRFASVVQRFRGMYLYWG